MARARILVVDDEESPRESLRYILKDRYEVVVRSSGTGGIEAVRADGPFDVVLLDMKLNDMSGLEVLSKILQLVPTMPIVMITGLSEAKPAVQAMKLGARDYLNKPFDVDEIRLIVQRILKERELESEVGRLRTELQTNYKFESMIGNSAAMQRLYALIQRLMNTDTTVLIHGETGTGKELVARALHYNSVRKEGPFIPLHCAAIPSELLESELFGHEKGSFTGAMDRRVGMFEAASGGTLFLDEIGEMPVATQSKLLRAIQEREIRRVGGQDTIHINVRLLCATNRNLEEEVKAGNFREDLFYRINVVPVLIPPLRDRREDIPQLVHHFAERLGRDLRRPVPQFSPPAMELLLNYPWPGNVRELEHAVERLIVTCDTNRIEASDLPFAISQADGAIANAANQLAAAPAGATDLRDRFGAADPALKTPPRLEFHRDGIDLTELTDNLEREAIEEALKRSNGVITEAARLLNITRRMLRYKMNKLGIATANGQSDSDTEEPVENGTLA